MNNRNINTELNEKFYILGKIAFVPVIVFCLIFANYIYPDHWKIGIFENCVFKSISGFPCPGCGGTRALVSLFRGNVVDSFFYNPSVIYAFLAYIHFWFCMYINKHSNIKKISIKVELYAYIFVGIILIQWIIKIVYILLTMN